MRLAVAIGMIFAAHADAQDLRGTLTGLVSDPSGASVEGALVRITNVGTQSSAATLTNRTGRYALLGLVPGAYSLEIEAAGFKRAIRKGIMIETSVRAGIDVQLEVGAASDSITVTGNITPLETETGSRGTTIARQQIVDLPNNGRNIYQLVWAAAGVTKTSTYWGSMENYATGNASNTQVGGGIRRENESLIDGVTNTQPNRDVVFQPPIEAVEEVRVQTNTYDASYGRFGGGVVAITTRSGSNAFHGTLFETNKVAALAANAWLFNSLGQARQHFVNNTFGFQMGGPIRHDRVFFLAAYEGLRQRSSGNAATIVPTARQREGDYSEFSRVIYDPLTTRPEGSGFSRLPFTGNRIPASRLDPVAQQLLNFVPFPNLQGRAYPLANLATFDSAENAYDQVLSRLDLQPHRSNRLYLSYGQLPFEEFRGQLFGPNSPAEPSNSNPLRRDFQHAVANWTSTLGAQTVLQLRAGLTRYVNTRGNPAAVGFDPRTLGFSDRLVSQFRFLAFPHFNIGGGYTTLGTPQVFLREARDVQSEQVSISHLAGAHLFTIGGELRIYNENTRSPGRASGQYGFSKVFTQANPLAGDSASGDELASFLLGYPASGAVDLNIDPALQGRYYSAFAQDSWKITSRVALDIGLRWDYERPYAERYNRMLRGFSSDTPSPIAGQPQGLDLRGVVQFAGTEGEDRLAFRPDRNNLQPRLGAAYRISENWVIRGGYGLYYLGANSAQPFSGFSQTTTLTSSLDGGNTPRVTLANGFPEDLLLPTGSSGGSASFFGRAVQAGYLNRVLPYSHQYGLSAERLLPGGILAEIAYSGNSTRRYPVTAQLNTIPVPELGRPDAYYLQRVPNPMAGLLPANPAKNGATIPRQDLLLPFPQYTTVTMTDVPIGRSSYHALQATLFKRYSSGITFNIAYTFSKTLEQLTFLNPQDFNPREIDRSKLEKRLAQFDAPHKFSAIATYELPFGRGKRWGQAFGPTFNWIIGGWQLNGFLILQSGFPADFPNAAPLRMGSAALPRSDVNLYHAFDTSLFPRSAPNLQYTLRTFPTRYPDVRLYPLRNVDASLAKKTRLTERIGLEIRAEFLNAANHPWFSRLHDRGTDVTRPEFGWYQLEEQNQNRFVTLICKLSW